MASWRKELCALSRRAPNEAEAKALIKTLTEIESDRGCALIAGAVIEDIAEFIIRARIRNLNTEQQTGLFGPEGTLGTLSSKVRVAFAFALIDKEINDQFDRMREIRNAFAHASFHITFDTNEIRKACEGIFQAPGVSDLSPRERYINTAVFLMCAGIIAMSSDKRRPAITYNEVKTLYEKWPRQSLEKTQENHREENKEPTP
jgi:hypothetical protein